MRGCQFLTCHCVQRAFILCDLSLSVIYIVTQHAGCVKLQECNYPYKNKSLKNIKYQSEQITVVAGMFNNMFDNKKCKFLHQFLEVSHDYNMQVVWNCKSVTTCAKIDICKTWNNNQSKLQWWGGCLTIYLIARNVNFWINFLKLVMIIFIKYLMIRPLRHVHKPLWYCWITSTVEETVGRE